MVAEHMLDIKAQVVVIDPVGVWWGLRVDADGKRKGKEIFVIGGDHGDVPLIPEAGAKIAKLLVEKGVSAVIDVSGFRLGEFKRFSADFAEEFFHLKKGHRSPVHVFVEEAQKIIPQRVGPDEARMVGAFEQIVRLGRNYGIGCSIITQRPQSVNKEVLSQVECLCVLQVTGPHERKALEEWVQEVGADRTLIKELPGLERGEGYVWSPSWLRIYKRVHFAKKQTFDASATPVVGQKTKAASISAVDVEALKKDMAEVIATAEKDNPVALRNHIKKLEKLLAVKNGNFVTKETIKEVADPKAIKKAVDEMMALRDTQDRSYEVLITKEIESAKKIFDGMLKMITQRQKHPLKPMYGSFVKIDKKVLHPGVLIKDIEKFKSLGEREADKEASSHLTHALKTNYIDADVRDVKPLTKCARAILSYLHSVYPNEKTKPQLWIATGYAPGGGFNNALAELTVPGYVEKYQNGFRVSADENYDKALLDESFDPDLKKWDAKLTLCARKVFHLLLQDPDTAVSKAELAEQTGYAQGGGFNNAISELMTPELIKKVEGGYIINPKILDL